MIYLTNPRELEIHIIIRFRKYACAFDTTLSTLTCRYFSAFWKVRVLYFALKQPNHHLFCIPVFSHSLFLHLFMIAAFHTKFNDTDGRERIKLYFPGIRYQRSVSCWTNYRVKRMKFLSFFVCYSSIVFLVNPNKSGIHNATRFLQNTLEFTRDVSFWYLRITLSILLYNFSISYFKSAERFEIWNLFLFR